jgi:hypothetical protein
LSWSVFNAWLCEKILSAEHDAVYVAKNKHTGFPEELAACTFSVIQQK